MELIIDIDEGFHNPLVSRADGNVPVSHFTIVFETTCNDPSCMLYVIEVNRPTPLFNRPPGHGPRKSSELFLPLSGCFQRHEFKKGLVALNYETNPGQIYGRLPPIESLSRGRLRHGSSRFRNLQTKIYLRPVSCQ